MLDTDNNVKKILHLQSKVRLLRKRNNHKTTYIISEIKIIFSKRVELKRPKKKKLMIWEI